MEQSPVQIVTRNTRRGYMKSIEKLSHEEQEVKVLINSLKNVLTDVPYDFVYEDDGSEDADFESEEYYD